MRALTTEYLAPPPNGQRAEKTFTMAIAAGQSLSVEGFVYATLCVLAVLAGEKISVPPRLCGKIPAIIP